MKLGQDTGEMHDYHDLRTGVLAASLAKRAPGYTSLDFPDLSAPQPAHHVLANRRDQPVCSGSHSSRQDSGRGGLKPNHCSTTRDSLTAAARTPLPMVTERSPAYSATKNELSG